MVNAGKQTIDISGIGIGGIFKNLESGQQIWKCLLPLVQLPQ